MFHLNTIYDRHLYNVSHGMPFDTKGDLYRSKHGLPLTESPERFLASRTNPRKNKDYRPRFRNFVIGFPVYKKDNYMRHWYNLLEILKDVESPIMRYSKIFLGGYVASFVFFAMNPKFEIKDGTTLMNRKIDISKNYAKPFMLWESFNRSFKYYGRKSTFFAIFFTVWFIVSDYMRKHRQMSVHKANFQTSMLLAPAVVFLMKDKLIPNYFFVSFITGMGIYFFFYALLNHNKGRIINIFSSPNSEKLYFKEVSKDEREKIEFQDLIETYTRNFLLNDIGNFRYNSPSYYYPKLI